MYFVSITVNFFYSFLPILFCFLRNYLEIFTHMLKEYVTQLFRNGSIYTTLQIERQYITLCCMMFIPKWMCFTSNRPLYVTVLRSACCSFSPAYHWHLSGLVLCASRPANTSVSSLFPISQHHFNCYRIQMPFSLSSVVNQCIINCISGTLVRWCDCANYVIGNNL